MWRFALRRLAQTVPLLLFLSLLLFALFKAIPGDYLSEMELNPAVSPETVQKLRLQYGLDRSLPLQYAYWLGSTVSGDFGYSFAQRRPASAVIAGRLGKTLVLALGAFALTMLLALPLGTWAAFREGSWPDHLILAFSLAGLSMPTLLAALGFLYLAFATGWFPLVADAPGGLFLPSLTLALPASAFLIRTLRLEVLDTLQQPFIRALAARGLPRRRILWHALRNALNPVISLLGLLLGSFLGGAVIVEKVFQWPGLGALAVDSILSRDLFVALNTLLVGACLTIAANLMADVLLALNDPRVRTR